MTATTREKIERIKARIANGESVKSSLRAEHMADATWYGAKKRERQTTNGLHGEPRSKRLATVAKTRPLSKREALLRELVRELL